MNSSEENTGLWLPNNFPGIVSEGVHSHSGFRKVGVGGALAFEVGAVAVADPALGVARGPPRYVLHQLAEGLWPLLPAGGIGADVSIAGKVENGREQP